MHESHQEHAPDVRLAVTSGGIIAAEGRAITEASKRPALLVSYVYLDPFLKNQRLFHYRDWALDSGAFSAHQQGTEISNRAYIDAALQLRASDPTLTDVFALDVIGDWRASLKNTEEAWAAGLEAIPCFHAGEPWDALLEMARTYPKIALGGVALQRTKQKMAWAHQCFARVWPKRIHGFGYGSKAAILGLPFHSTDATNWEVGPCKFGSWRSFGGALSVRGSKQNLRSEVEYYLKIEAQARKRWKKEMALLASIPEVQR